MCGWIQIYTYICDMLPAGPSTCTAMQEPNGVCLYLHGYVYTLKCVYIYMCGWIHIHIYAASYTRCMYGYAHAEQCVYICTWVCVHVYMCVYIYIHIYIYIYRYVCVFVCGWVYKHIHIYMWHADSGTKKVYGHTNGEEWVYTSILVYTSTWMCIHVYILNMYMCMCVYIHTHIFIWHDASWTKGMYWHAPAERCVSMLIMCVNIYSV